MFADTSNVQYLSRTVALRAMLENACDFTDDQLMNLDYRLWLENLMELHGINLTNRMRCGIIFLMNNALDPEINSHSKMSPHDVLRMNYYSDYFEIQGFLKYPTDNNLMEAFV